LKSLSSATLAALGFVLFFSAAPSWPQPPAPPAASQVVLTLDPAQSTVHWSVGSTVHTVHGTFTLKSGTIHFDPQTGKAGGEIIVSAMTGESGNGSRDARMHKEILETAKYPEMVFRPAQVEGKVDPSGPSDAKLSGVFAIHGANHDLTAQVHAQLSRDRWSATASFDVPYVQWGIKSPSNFLLKVKPVVNVEVEMSGTIQATN
jgi:polyisoprenoid-binding protein YceI